MQNAFCDGNHGDLLGTIFFELLFFIMNIYIYINIYVLIVK